MLPAGFEPAIPASDLPQTLALDSSATGTCQNSIPEPSSPYGLRYAGTYFTLGRNYISVCTFHIYFPICVQIGIWGLKLLPPSLCEFREIISGQAVRISFMSCQVQKPGATWNDAVLIAPPFSTSGRQKYWFMHYQFLKFNTKNVHHPVSATSSVAHHSLGFYLKLWDNKLHAKLWHWK